MKKKFIMALIVVLLICTAYSTINAENLSDLQAQKEQIKNELSGANENLEGLQVELTEALEEVSKVEVQIAEGEAELEETTAKLEELEKEIKQIQEKLNVIETDYEKQKDMFEKRIVALYEMGETTYLDVLLSSKSITDFISNYYLIGEVAQYDSELLDTIEREKDKIEQIKEQITQKNNDLKLVLNKKNN